MLRKIFTSSITKNTFRQAFNIQKHSAKYFSNDDKVKFYFIDKDDNKIVVNADKGISILDIAHENGIDLEGACESSLACSTCHVILEDEIFMGLPEAEIEEEDLLDLAFGLTATSRLGCQCKIDESFEGTEVTLPKATRNFYVDGFKPKPH